MSEQAQADRAQATLEPRDQNHDSNAEVRLHASRPLRLILVVIGTLSLFAGIAGIFLPLVPTTPFLLLSAACYARSSARFYNWLMNQKLLGPYIRSYRDSGTVPMRAKLLAIFLIIVTMGSSIVFLVPVFGVRVALGAIGIAVIIFIARLPSEPPPSKRLTG